MAAECWPTDKACCAGANHSAALELWHLAADGNIAEAFYMLGKACETGQGVPTNLTRAMAWYSHGYGQAAYTAEATALLLAWYGAGAKRWFLGSATLLQPLSLGACACIAVLQYGAAKLAGGLDALGGLRTLGTLCVGLAGVLWLRCVRRRQRASRPC